MESRIDEGFFEADNIHIPDNHDLTKRDMLSFISAAVDHQGLIGHNIDGFNELMDNGINDIMQRLFSIEQRQKNIRTQTEADKNREGFTIKIQFHDVKIDRPTCTTYYTGQVSDLYPSRARLTGLPYAGAVTMGTSITLQTQYLDKHIEERSVEIPLTQVGSFPTMLGSNQCHTHYCTRSILKNMGEDPSDSGGYFVAKRGEYVVDLLENIRYNSMHMHTAVRPNEHVRAEFLSQPGGTFSNSSQVRIRYLLNGQITIEINSTKLEKVSLPFYLLYRIIALTSDREIAETIVFDVEDENPVEATLF
ncbi:15664_t:CDS:1 [Funneliformis geosporum]|uniref:DNA-directed RNA polymerase n=1 Tax=Funneliformis geosporum TaxID=1117311 RepID=A0A9W4SEN7_9GLOM|nr:3922_t:CDS:1 [Funneliformis geosporum]CAI2176765.1 15664_t:CDS:1 [Funneliformis geosporum]